jgi:hypothetical protein
MTTATIPWSTPTVEQLFDDATGLPIKGIVDAHLGGGAPVEIIAGTAACGAGRVEHGGLKPIGYGLWAHSEDPAYRADSVEVLVVPKELPPRDRIKLAVRDDLIQKGHAAGYIRIRVIRLAKEYANETLTDRHAADLCRAWLKEFRAANP